MRDLKCFALVSDWKHKVEKNEVAVALGEQGDKAAITENSLGI